MLTRVMCYATTVCITRVVRVGLCVRSFGRGFLPTYESREVSTLSISCRRRHRHSCSSTTNIVLLLSELAIRCTTLYLTWHPSPRGTATGSEEELVADEAEEGSAARAAIRLTSSMTVARVKPRLRLTLPPVLWGSVRVRTKRHGSPRRRGGVVDDKWMGG